MSKGYLENVTFMIIEDNAFMRSIIKAVLRALGALKINEAADGALALKIMKTAMPDIIIVDWEMQPLDGIEFVKMVRRSHDSPNPFVPIVMLSGHSEQRRVMEARDAGVNEFVVKPISAKTLFTRIHSVIERPRPFVKTRLYFGPDRRRRQMAFQGPDRRKSQSELLRPAVVTPAIAPAAPAPAAPMGQDAVDAMFAAPAAKMDQGSVDALFDSPAAKPAAKMDQGAVDAMFDAPAKPENKLDQNAVDTMFDAPAKPENKLDQNAVDALFDTPRK